MWAMRTVENITKINVHPTILFLILLMSILSKSIHHSLSILHTMNTILLMTSNAYQRISLEAAVQDATLII